MDHIDVNNRVTLETLKTNRTPEVIQSVIQRLNDVYEMCKDYMNEDMTIFDIGTKDCLFFDVLVEKGFNKDKMIGIDCCEQVVNMCRDKGYNIHYNDVQDMPYDYEDWFDIIFIIHTLEHVPNPQGVVDKCKEILKPNGFLFIEVPIQQYEDPELWGHYHTFESHEKLKELFTNGYRIVKEDWQKTQSKKPWYRVLFQRGLK